MTVYPTIYHGLIRKARPAVLTTEPFTVPMGKRLEKDRWDPLLPPQELLFIESTSCVTAEDDEGNMFISEERAELYHAMRSLLDELMRRGEEITCVLPSLILTRAEWHSPYLP
jgi:hypothetical protein